MTVDRIETATAPVRNPANPNHLMWVRPVDRVIRVRVGDHLLAESREALRVVEVGRDLYDPALYLPLADVAADLRVNERSTHCPLKGDASYFDWVGADGAVRIASIAWSYRAAFDFAEIISGRVAFYPQYVSFEDAPLS